MSRIQLKGNSFERDCEESLQQHHKDCYRTHERGYITQYDLHCESGKFVIECKRLKGLSWNQAHKFFQKLKQVTPEQYKPYLLFQSNNQPCLVMWDDHNKTKIATFETVFELPFKKHTPTKKKKTELLTKEVVSSIKQ